jgi:heme exporter protein C
MRSCLVGVALLLGIALGWAGGFVYAPMDANQGQVYRIIFLHVPSAFAAFFTSLLLFIFSVKALRAESEKAMQWSKACAEVGLLYTGLTLVTGSIWGRPTWGVWWTWDPRLTTTFLLALLYAGYLLLFSSMAPGPGRKRAAGVLGILIFVDVPIIYKSVTWWNTLHQPPSMLREGGPSMDPAIFYTLLINVLIMCAYSFWLIMQRAHNLALQDELESLSFDQIE